MSEVHRENPPKIVYSKASRKTVEKESTNIATAYTTERLYNVVIVVDLELWKRKSKIKSREIKGEDEKKVY